MSFEVKQCALDEVSRHPTLAGRTRARVKVRLRETRADQTFDHDLTLKVWAATNDDMTPDQVRTALLARAAHILRRTVAVADLEAHRQAAE